MYQVGDIILTQRSGDMGTILEVVECANGSFRYRIDVDGNQRWTTYKP